MSRGRYDSPPWQRRGEGWFGQQPRRIVSEVDPTTPNPPLPRRGIGRGNVRQMVCREIRSDCKSQESTGYSPMNLPSRSCASTSDRSRGARLPRRVQLT